MIEEEKTFIPPDYTEDEIESDISDVDEGQEDLVLDVLHEINKEEENNNKKEENNMSATTPFSQQSWGNSGNNTSSFWNSNNNGNNNSSNFWGSSQQKPSGWGWGSSLGVTQQTSNKTEINRNKKVIFCDFLDVIVETYQSNGQPGLIPRDIYDLKPRFDVWAKLAAFNPERIYAIIPTNLMPSTNGSQGWMITLEYFCCCLSSFIRVPYTNCQILAQSSVGQPKESIIGSVINNTTRPIPKEDVISIGVYSGENGQSNVDIYAASICNIDYVDLNRLLNNMY